MKNLEKQKHITKKSTGSITKLSHGNMLSNIDDVYPVHTALYAISMSDKDTLRFNYGNTL